MIIGGLPLLVISVLNHDPALNGHLQELTLNDVLALLYTSIFGSAISYGVYFYNATRGKITSHSCLAFTGIVHKYILLGFPYDYVLCR
jgi:drug/metabolite transporter (DMT)-like permease